MAGCSWSGHLENAGLLLCSSTCEVFNVHTRAFYRLPPGLASTSRLPTAGMVVDSSVSPNSFQIIVASGDMRTQIYDSRSNCWTPRLSTRSYRAAEDAQEATNSCVCCNGIVYLMSIADCDMDDVLIETYDLRKDEWGTLKPPPPNDVLMRQAYLGAWQGKLFHFKMDLSCGHLTAWVLTDRSQQEWAVYDRMPVDLYSWVAYRDGQASTYRDGYGPLFLTKFCHEYVLVYTSNFDVGYNSWLCSRCVLYRLDTKSWEKIELDGLGLPK